MKTAKSSWRTTAAKTMIHQATTLSIHVDVMTQTNHGAEKSRLGWAIWGKSFRKGDTVTNDVASGTHHSEANAGVVDEIANTGLAKLVIAALEDTVTTRPFSTATHHFKTTLALVLVTSIHSCVGGSDNI